MRFKKATFDKRLSGCYDAYIHVKDGRVDDTVPLIAAEVYADIDERGNILGIEVLDIFIDKRKPKKEKISKELKYVVEHVEDNPGRIYNYEGFTTTKPKKRSKESQHVDHVNVTKWGYISPDNYKRFTVGKKKKYNQVQAPKTNGQNM